MSNVSKQRLYLDESGDHATNNLQPQQWNRRYLALFGCSFDVTICHNKFAPDFESFKVRHFGGDVDDPVILHREDVKAKSGPFCVLTNEETCKAFDDELLAMIASTSFRAFVVVIDKITIPNKRFGPIDTHPYHVGLLTLMERYCEWLKRGVTTGDVLAESRGGKEDMALKAAYSTVYSQGTRFQPATFFQRHLSSKEIKVKPKSQNISALQFADLLAYPAKRQLLYEHGLAPAPFGFTKEVASALEKKYHKKWNGRVPGYGKILII